MSRKICHFKDLDKSDWLTFAGVFCSSLISASIAIYTIHINQKNHEEQIKIEKEYQALKTKQEEKNKLDLEHRERERLEIEKRVRNEERERVKLLNKPIFIVYYESIEDDVNNKKEKYDYFSIRNVGSTPAVNLLIKCFSSTDVIFRDQVPFCMVNASIRIPTKIFDGTRQYSNWASTLVQNSFDTSLDLDNPLIDITKIQLEYQTILNEKYTEIFRINEYGVFERELT